jgi:hypothetical protein
VAMKGGPYERGNSSVVERHLAKVDVAGPTPVSRSYNRRFGNLAESPLFLHAVLRAFISYSFE